MTARPVAETPAMADYGVGGDTWEPLDWGWAAERLVPNRNYWVVTVGADARPHAMPVWGIWDDEELRFEFGCAPTARKARNIAANAHVTFTGGDTVECISVQGEAWLVADPERIEWWADRQVAKYGDESGPDYREFVKENAVFEVRPTVAFGIIERADEFSARATRWRFA